MRYIALIRHPAMLATMATVLLLAAGEPKAVPSLANLFPAGKTIQVNIDAENGVIAGFETEIAIREYLEAVRLGSRDTILAALSNAAFFDSTSLVRVVASPKSDRLPLPVPIVQVAGVKGAGAGKTLWLPAQSVWPGDVPRLRDEPLVPFLVWKKDPSLIPEPGDELILWDDDRDNVYIAKDLFAYDDLIKFLIAKDTDGVADLLKRRRVALTATGTRVRVIKRHDNQFIGEGVRTLECRVLSGPYQGEAVWTRAANVTRLTLDITIRSRPIAKRTEPKSARAKPGKPAATPNRAAVLFGLGWGLDKADKNEAALEYYRKLIKEYPNSPEAKKAAARIKVIQGGR